MYANNPAYQLVFQHVEYTFYIPTNITDYHKSREQEAIIQNIYSNSGATAETIRDICEAGIEMINKDKNSDQLRTNMTAIMHNLIYRTKYPVDSLCGIRMASILTYLEYGDQSEPLTAEMAWINKKVQLALMIPELYDFFLRFGISSTEAYSNHLNTLKSLDYFSSREQTIQSFYPSAKE